ncbi:MAG: hypothetical protein AAF613_10135 [Pseudomonadota bacterium]
MLQRPTTLIALAATAMVAAPLAHADTQAQAEACQTSLQALYSEIANPELAEATFNLTAARGVSKRKLSFDMWQDGDKTELTCVIRRGEVLEIITPDKTLVPAQRLAEADTQ